METTYFSQCGQINPSTIRPPLIAWDNNSNKKTAGKVSLRQLCINYLMSNPGMMNCMIFFPNKIEQTTRVGRTTRIGNHTDFSASRTETWLSRKTNVIPMIVNAAMRKIVFQAIRPPYLWAYSYILYSFFAVLSRLEASFGLFPKVPAVNFC